MNTKRPYYRTKAEWADATAQQFQDQLDASYREPRIPSSNWRAVRNRASSRDNVRQEVTRYRQMAERFRAQGL